MNKGSVFGKFGSTVQEACIPLLNYELIHCIASDAHSPIQRTPWLRDIYQFLKDNFDEEYASRLLESNPYRIVTGQSVPTYAIDPLQE